MIEACYRQLLSEEAMYRAWRKVRGKGSAGGVDKVTVQAFEENAPAEIRKLCKELETGAYLPQPYLAIKIPKKKAGEYRKLGMLSVRDKIVQQAVFNLIYEPMDRLFLDVSYGYRQGKGPVKAIRRVVHLIRMEKRRWVCQLDFHDFFDNIPHDRLQQKLADLIRDRDLIHLIMLCLKMGRVTKQLDWQEVTKGVPQGAVLSPLLANLYLHEFDEYMAGSPLGYVRYADDFLVLGRQKAEAETARKKIQTFARKKLQLPLNPGGEVRSLKESVEFLGITFYEKYYGLSDAKQARLKERLQKAVGWKDGKLSPKLQETVEGIQRYYGQLLPEEQLLPLDQHLQESVKTAIDKNRKKFRSLRSLRRALAPLEFLTPTYRKKRSAIMQELVGAGRKKPPGRVEISPEAALRKRKKEYEKLQSASLELLISKPGVYLGISRSGITVREKGKLILSAPTANVQHITVLSKGVSLSSNLIWYCAQHQIPIDFYDKFGRPYSRMYTVDTTDDQVWQEQLKALQDGRFEAIGKTIVSGKLRNQLNLIRYYSKYYKNESSKFTETYERNAAKIKKLIKKVGKIRANDLSELRGQLFAAEGQGGSLYWQVVRQLLKEKYGFEGRVRQGATDLTNSLLNYGYAILYSRIWDAVLKAQLNPYISYLHARQPGKPTLTYDLIEEFRQPVVDRPVFAMIRRNEKLRIEDGRLTLKTRRKVAERILDRLHSAEKFRGRRLRLSEIVRQQARDFATYLKGGATGYKPYSFKW